MKKSKYILVAHDFSEASKNALKVAAQIADAKQSRLFILNVLPITVMSDVEYAYTYSPDSDIQRNTTLMRRAISFLKRDHPQLNMTFSVTYAYVIPAILEAIKSYNPWLTILGVKKRSGLDRVIFGDVCTELVDKVDEPILVIPMNVKSFETKHVVYAWDGLNMQTAHLHLLKKLMSKEKQLVSAINVTHYDDKVQKNAIEYKKILAKYLYNHITDVVQIQGLDKPQTISNYLAKIKPDLLVVVAHHYGFFQKLFHKSFSKQALRFAKSPVLVIKK